MKSSGFREERERRIIFKPQGTKFDGKRLLKGTKNAMEPRVRATTDRVIQYFEYPLPTDAIAELILGPKNESEAEAISLLLGSSEYQEVKVSSSAVSYR
jgi:hypothetical protein